MNSFFFFYLSILFFFSFRFVRNLIEIRESSQKFIGCSLVGWSLEFSVCGNIIIIGGKLDNFVVYI